MAASGVFTLQDATAYNASVTALKGVLKGNVNYGVIWLWFAPTGSYDGTVNFEISPDGGTTWFVAQGIATGAIGTLVSTVASPVATTSYYVYLPSGCSFRARMSGGTQGALSVFGRFANYPYAKAS